MGRWQLGSSEVEAHLDAGELQRVSGSAANGERLLLKAHTTLATARLALDTDPDSAFVLAYDAARQALTALLAQQGLRPTTQGVHFVVEQTVKAQFGSGFREFGALRRRRNELEYPRHADDDASAQEASEAIASAEAILSAARGLVGQLGILRLRLSGDPPCQAPYSGTPRAAAPTGVWSRNRSLLATGCEQTTES